MGRSAGVLPLPRPGSVPGTCEALVPGLGPACISMLDDWVMTVNELNSGSPDCGLADGDPLSAAQTSAYVTASSQIARFSSVPAEGRDADCFQAVAGGLDYQGAPSSFTPLQESLLSLRPEGSVPLTLASLAAADVNLACSDVNSCVVPSDLAAHNLQAAGVETPFMDPGVKRSSRAYHRVLRRLHASGMLDFVGADQEGAVIEHVGFFAVEKKNGRQRLVIDCRRSNCWFAEP